MNTPDKSILRSHDEPVQLAGLKAMIWQVITPEIKGGMSWGIAILALESVLDTAKSNREFGLGQPEAGQE